MTSSAPAVAVVGAGAWGTALAQTLSAKGGPVRLWAREPQVVDAINAAHENTLYLPGVPLSPEVVAVGDMDALAGSSEILMVAPAQHLRAVLSTVPRLEGAWLTLCAKGIEAGSLKLMHEVAAEFWDRDRLCVLSGPTFAHEVAAGLPTAVTIAARDQDAAEARGRLFAGTNLRPYMSTDVTGAEVGGAVKNVLAIACGVVEGRGLGQNARAALISRGFAEMTRFGLAKGARAETLAGLSGLGDLVLTCSSTSSRNFSLGKGIGEGRQAADLLADRRSVAEGAFTAPVLLQAARELSVDMPVVEAVCALLKGDVAVEDAIRSLFARPVRSEGA